MYANQGFGSEAWLQMAKHVVMSMHVCVCCANKLILIVRVVIMLVAI